MKGEHFHEEWAFRVVFSKRGVIMRERLFLTLNARPMLSQEEVLKCQAEAMENFSAYIAEHGGEAGCDFDSVETFAPVRRIVTEWEVAWDHENQATDATVNSIGGEK